MVNKVLEIFYIVIQKSGAIWRIANDAGEIEINSYTYINSFMFDNFVIIYKEY